MTAPQRREQILEVARRLFAEHGYRAVASTVWSRTAGSIARTSTAKAARRLVGRASERGIACVRVVMKTSLDI